MTSATNFTGSNYSISVADGTETINGHECSSGQLIITHPQGTEVFDTFGELVEAHPVAEEARDAFSDVSYNVINAGGEILNLDGPLSKALALAFADDAEAEHDIDVKVVEAK
jgi:hypothetical protein